MLKSRRRWKYRKHASNKVNEVPLSAPSAVPLNHSAGKQESSIQDRFSASRRQQETGRRHTYIAARSILLAANGYGVLLRPPQQEDLN